LTKLPLLCSTAPLEVLMTPLCVRAPARASVPPPTASVPVLTTEPRSIVCVDGPDFASVPALAVAGGVVDVRRGLIVDVETTGLDTSNDHIIELGLVGFEFDAAGMVYGVDPQR
jgi:DNA polymerase III epsilon subunit-like protein